jgi:hypothetical protein
MDAGCRALLWRLTRSEGIRLFALVGFKRTRLVRDVLLGLVLAPAFMPLTFDARFMAFRLLSSVPHSVFVTFLYLNRLLPQGTEAGRPPKLTM